MPQAARELAKHAEFIAAIRILAALLSPEVVVELGCCLIAEPIERAAVCCAIRHDKIEYYRYRTMRPDFAFDLSTNPLYGSHARAADGRGWGMWAITTYFNPMKYARRAKNYRAFRANLSVPLVAVELTFDGVFELRDDDADIVVRLNGGAVLWQKERLLNVALRALPSEVTEVAWIDCDVLFAQPDWALEAEKALQRAPIVQLFSQLYDLEPDEMKIP